MHNVFYVLVLEQNITKKREKDENITLLKFEASDSKKYKIEAIWNNAIYKKELKLGQLSGLYYLISWKG